MLPQRSIHPASDLMRNVLPSLAQVAEWGSAALVLGSGWAAGHGLAAGMDTLHCAAAGFAVSGSIFLALTTRGRLPELSRSR